MRRCNGILGLSLSLYSFFLGFSACSSSNSLRADLVLLDGKIWTGNPGQPEVEAVAVWQGRILALGSNAEIGTFVGDTTRVIDAQGRRVLPGLIDNHTHFVTGGFWISGVQLKDAATQQEFGERLAARSRKLPEGSWITGGTWDHDNWPGGELPSAELIDRYVPDRPVFVTRYDGHMSVANSLALQLAGVDAATPDPAGGVIVRKTKSREPAGVLKDTAQGMINRIIPGPGRTERKLAIKAALARARSLGITSLTDMDLDTETLGIYQEFFAEGKLTARIDGRWPLAQWEQVAGAGFTQNFPGREWIRVGGVKGFVDGSLGSSTALFRQPYLQDPSTSGVYVTPLDELRTQIFGAARAGLQVAVHAIGDRANSELLEIYKEFQQEEGSANQRFHIEHAQHIAPEDFKRFADLGVIVCAQPFHAIDDGRWAEKRIGHERSRTTYAFRSFLDNQVKMSFGSDWTVAPLSPLAGIEAAVTRQTTDGANPEGWFPEQKISVDEAIQAYTITAAYATFDDDIKGSLEVGKLADMIVLSDDIRSIPPEQISEVVVIYTILGGRIVYESTPG